MEPRTIDTWRYPVASVALVLGTLGLSACGDHEEPRPTPSVPSETRDWQKELSDWIGEQAGLYDENGDIIPRDTVTKESDANAADKQ